SANLRRKHCTYASLLSFVHLSNAALSEAGLSNAQLHRPRALRRQRTITHGRETPRGSNIKLDYEPEMRAFTVSRALPLGLVYPYDWGFIPGTNGEDGDLIDALAVHDGATYPGVILPCR